MKMSSETLQNLSYFWNKVFFSFFISLDNFIKHKTLISAEWKHTTAVLRKCNRYYTKHPKCWWLVKHKNVPICVLLFSFRPKKGRNPHNDLSSHHQRPKKVTIETIIRNKKKYWKALLSGRSGIDKNGSVVVVHTTTYYTAVGTRVYLSYDFFVRSGG